MIKRNIIVSNLWKSLLFCVVILIICGAIYKLNHMDRRGTSKWEEYLHKGETLIDGVEEGDLSYLIISTNGRTDYGNYLVILESEGAKYNRKYENNFHDLRPWKIDVADVDGDGIIEIITVVKKAAHYDKEIRNRLFLFNYENNVLVKKWTGSQIGGNWKQVYIGDLVSIPGEEIILVEQTEQKLEKLGVYYWFDFGFLKLAESKEYQNIKEITICGGNQIRMMYGTENQIECDLTLKDGKIVELNSMDERQ
ncbi:MAG: hypothetical protein QM644_12165 [Mobilitalea sp.]